MANNAIAKLVTIVIVIYLSCSYAYAEDDRIELKTTMIKGNKELPKILYVVPWKDVKRSKLDEQKLELHSLFGDLFEPVLPKQASNTQQ